MLIGEWLYSSKSVLENISETAPLDSQIILSLAIEASRSYILTHRDATLSSKQVRKAEKYLKLITNGMPLPYLIRQWDFFGHTFHVSKKTLIPRPETELLVDCALNWLKMHTNSVNIADVGTGTGCVAISICLEFPSKKYYATDISRHALELAKVNLSQYNLDQIITFVRTNLLKNICVSFDLICANLPYIPTHRLQLLNISKTEPIQALDGGIDGFRIIEDFLSSSRQWLKPEGCIICEIDDTHSLIAEKTAKKYWQNRSIKIQKDHNGKPRLLIIE